MFAVPDAQTMPRSRRSRWGWAALLTAGALLAGACGGAESATPDPAPQGDAAAQADDGAQDVDTPTTEAPTTTRPLRSFTVAASGDLLLHTPVMASGQQNAGGEGYDFNPMFDEVRDVISRADLAICHQETPISYDNTELTGYPIFNAPRDIAPAIVNAGYDACEATSNHSLDKGFDGVKATLDVFDENGIAHTGTGRSPEEVANPPIYEVNGVRIGHLAFTYSYNGIPVPADAPWLAELLYPEIGLQAVLDRAHQLRERGAEFVIISMQWGNEYQQAPTEEQRQWAKDLLSSPDVDLILGDHVHVIQPCEKINGKYVHYGMGNFLSNQSPNAGLLASTQDGVIASYQIQETSPGVFATTSMTYAPTFVNIPGHDIQLATPDRHPQSHERTVEAMTALGPGACDATPEY